MALTREDHQTLGEFTGRVTGWGTGWSDDYLAMRRRNYEAIGLTGAVEACRREISRRVKAQDVERLLAKANRAWFWSRTAKRNRPTWEVLYAIRAEQLREALESCSRH